MYCSSVKWPGILFTICLQNITTLSFRLQFVRLCVYIEHDLDIVEARFVLAESPLLKTYSTMQVFKGYFSFH
mgnify:CR=1 FL=1